MARLRQLDADIETLKGAQLTSLLAAYSSLGYEDGIRVGLGLSARKTKLR
jgi:hypothetical protein